jgi:Zn-dependent protease with chaperone function
MTCSQSVVLPLAGIGWACALGNVNNAPTIASAKKPLRSCCLIFGLFIIFEFSLVVLAFRPFLGRRSLGEGGWRFTCVLEKIRREVTRKMQRQPRITRIRTEFYRKDRFGDPPKPVFYGALSGRALLPFLKDVRIRYPCNPWLSHLGAREATNVASSIFRAYGCFSDTNS